MTYTFNNNDGLEFIFSDGRLVEIISPANRGYDDYDVEPKHNLRQVEEAFKEFCAFAETLFKNVKMNPDEYMINKPRHNSSGYKTYYSYSVSVKVDEGDW
ncbi:MAG: hypothetical protein LC122_13885 [Chitinophagales bacterium]|nr:hypothetical protein [Chitinophagales bacterium]